MNAADRVRSEGSGGVFGAAVAGGGAGRGRGGGEGFSEVVADLTGLDERKDSVLGGIGGGREEEKKMTGGMKAMGPGAIGKNGQPLYVDSDEEDEGATRDIERIWISSDSEEDEQGPIGKKGKQRAKQQVKRGMGLRPLRAPRQMRDKEGAGSTRTEKEAGEGDEMDIDELFVTDGPLSPELKKSTKKRATKLKESKAPTETVEERAERSRNNEDMRKLREEFVGVLPPKRTSAAAPFSDAMNLENASDDIREGKLYLFQFPPLTPYLVDSEGHFDVNEALEDPQAVPPDAPSKIKAKDPGSEVKKEDDGEESKANIKTEIPGVLTARSMRLPSGLVGKLNVHKSGKVSLDWGGADLEVRYGNEVDFLQDAVLVGGDEGQSSWALGQVQKKLVVIPDWQKLYD
jgi:DNA-directed RNA polymerase III subunit RPC4